MGRNSADDRGGLPVRPARTKAPRVALSHDWLNGMRGGEKCLEVLCELFPDAPIYTLFYERHKVSEVIASKRVHVSALQSLPGASRFYRNLLPFYPAAIRGFRLQEADLLVSTSHCVAKGIRKPKGAVHLCYCFTPMRYAWTFFDDYFGKSPWYTKSLIRALLLRLRAWDRATSADVDHFVAISQHVRARIKEYYGRDARVIYPPADTNFYTVDRSIEREDFYLVVSALVPYKRVDLAIAAVKRTGKRLVVIGEGPERSRLERAAGPQVSFLGWGTSEALRDHYRRAKALIFPGEEDFGIVPVEAQACGCPVIAYKKGGALETIDEASGSEFFEVLTESSLAAALERQAQKPSDPEGLSRGMGRFSRERFRDQIKRCIEEVLP